MELPVIENKVCERLKSGINIFFDISLKEEAKVGDFIPGEIPGIKENHLARLPAGFNYSRKLYRSFSIDPTRYRPSSEALWRRVKKHGDFPTVNPFVDLTNLLSLKYQVPYGLYDLDLLEGDIRIDQGREGDAYQGIRKDTVNLQGKLMIRDQTGPFGNPSSDSLRTCTSEDTKNIMQVIFFHVDHPSCVEILETSYALFAEFFRMSAGHSYFV